MKITLWTFTWDTDFGTGAMVLTTEEAALAEMFDMAVADRVEPEDLERIRAEFEEDPYEVLQEYKKDIDTFSHESHTVEISAAFLARQWLKAWLDDVGMTWRRWQARRAT